MRKLIRGTIYLLRAAWRGQAGITGLSTAVIWIAFIIVGVTFATTMLTVGFFVSDKTDETVGSSVRLTASTMRITGAVFAEETITGGKVAMIKFKLTLAAGSRPVGLDSRDTLVTYIDSKNRVLLPYTGSNADTEPWWSHEWVRGGGEAVDLGDVVEITVGLVSTGGDALQPMFGPNETFKVEVLPREGTVIPMERTTPLRFHRKMNLG